MTDIGKPTMLGRCRSEVVEALAEQFDAAAKRSGGPPWKSWSRP